MQQALFSSTFRTDIFSMGATRRKLKIPTITRWAGIIPRIVPHIDSTVSFNFEMVFNQARVNKHNSHKNYFRN